MQLPACVFGYSLVDFCRLFAVPRIVYGGVLMPDLQTNLEVTFPEYGVDREVSTLSHVMPDPCADTYRQGPL